MRRRIQAVARGQGRCDCGPIGIRLSRNGRPGPAVGAGTADDGGGVELQITAISIYTIEDGYPADGYAALLLPYPENIDTAFSIDYGYSGSSPPEIGNRFGNFSEVIVPDPGNTAWLSVAYVYAGQTYTLSVF